jgi:uncharacterized repeat protein (TIGR03803 family)
MVESLGDFPKRNKILSFAKFTQAALLLLAGLPAVPLSRAQTYTVLYTFTGGTDGEFPAAALIQDSAGNLYGTASYGNPPQAGSVFKLSPSGKFKVLHSFRTGGADGARPFASLVRADGAHPSFGGLVMDAAGNLYGTTDSGGACGAESACGVVFKLDQSGNETVLHTL